MMTPWSAKTAFSRNIGLVSEAQQARLLQTCVAIPGCGGIGSTVAETLARLGIGRFRLCDPDEFDVVNFNRQMGATLSTVGRNKAEVVAERILSINPEATVELFAQPISADNAASFVSSAHIVLDGIDFFSLSARRAVFRAAEDQNLPAMTAAPLGFSATLQTFLPSEGMGFDEYFDFKHTDGSAEQITKFFAGLAPKALQRDYMQLRTVDVSKQAGPSSILGTQLAATLIGGEVIRIVLGPEKLLPAPWYRQFDAYRQIWVKRYLWRGNKNPAQRLKLILVKRAFQQAGLWDGLNDLALA